jgi:phage/plasmid-associated DNA primase
MEDALSGAHTDVTIALYRVYWLDFVYCSVREGKWYQFKNNRWHEINQGIPLRKLISSDFMRRFEAARVVLSRQIRDTSDESFKANAETTMKKITSLVGKLKTVPFKSSIMVEAREQFNQDKFSSLLDNNPDILGLTNGVIEILGPQALFRRSKPEDYVSMTSNVPYSSTFRWEHPLVLECMNWFNQVFPDNGLLHHFLKFAASCLKGRNSDKIFPIWTGSGDNSKSMIVKLFEAAFGSYCIKFPVALLTEKGGNSSGPTPQLARAKSTRIAFLDEPEDDIELAKGTIKRYTGGDSFFARLLQDNGGDVQATFKMILMCNKVPIIPNADKAIKNRTRLFPFMSTWTDTAPKEGECIDGKWHWKKDELFEKRIPILASAFLWILTQYFPYYSAEKLSDPQIVTDTTETYWKENDVYAQFAADLIQEVYTPDNKRDSTARVTLSEIYAEFKSWFRDSFPGTKVPERQFVKTELSSRWGNMVSNAWHGIRIAQDAAGMDMTSMLGGKKTTEKPSINGPVAKINGEGSIKPSQINKLPDMITNPGKNNSKESSPQKQIRVPVDSIKFNKQYDAKIESDPIDNLDSLPIQVDKMGDPLIENIPSSLELITEDLIQNGIKNGGITF